MSKFLYQIYHRVHPLIFEEPKSQFFEGFGIGLQAINEVNTFRNLGEEEVNSCIKELGLEIVS